MEFGEYTYVFYYINSAHIVLCFLEPLFFLGNLNFFYLLSVNSSSYGFTFSLQTFTAHFVTCYAFFLTIAKFIKFTWITEEREKKLLAQESKGFLFLAFVNHAVVLCWAEWKSKGFGDYIFHKNQSCHTHVVMVRDALRIYNPSSFAQPIYSFTALL